MSYHVIVSVEGKSLSTVEVGLSKKSLNSRIIGPYLEGKKFHCDGVLIDPYQVTKINIMKTKESVSQLLPKIREERSGSGIITQLSDEYFLAKRGKDVTRDFIKHAPKRNGIKESGTHWFTWALRIIAGIAALVTILSAIPLFLEWLGYSTQLLTPASELKVSILSKSSAEAAGIYGENSVMDIFNPLVQDNALGRLNLWLDSKNGRSTIYTKTISVSAHHFWTKLLEKEQYEIKPGESIQIPIQFTPNDDYWINRTDSEINNAEMIVQVRVNYDTKGKDISLNWSEVIPVSGLLDYYNRSIGYSKKGR